MKINGKKVVSIKSLCSKDNQPVLCDLMDLRRNESM